MFKKILVIVILLSTANSWAAVDLVEIFNEAKVHDPQFALALNKRNTVQNGVSLALASYLPQLNLHIKPSVTRTGYSGSNLQVVDGVQIAPRNTTQRNLQLALTASQRIFDANQLFTIHNAKILSESANAAMTTALQDLMIRVAKTYFSVLSATEKLAFNENAKALLVKQRANIRAKFRHDYSTQTEVDTVEAAYATAVAEVIAARNELAIENTNLMTLTGSLHNDLAKLKNALPLTPPNPNIVQRWVTIALRQNWEIQTQQFIIKSKKNQLHGSMANYLPTINIEASVDRDYSQNVNSYNTLNAPQGPGTQTNRSVGIDFNWNIISGGSDLAKMHAAKYDLENATLELELLQQKVSNQTYQNFYNIVTGKDKLLADLSAIKSTQSALTGLKASYELGGETLINVLTQQHNVLEKQKEYSQDRYNFILNTLMLKEAIGTLSFEDLRLINAWLG